MRGVHVRLDEAWREIRSRAEYPPAVAELLGEGRGRRGPVHRPRQGRRAPVGATARRGALRTLFAECTAAGTLRGIAQLGEGEGFAQPARGGLGGVLAITIENAGVGGREPVRYRGLVALSADSLAGAFEDYFRQSERTPTRLLLAADGHRAAGLMLQKLPSDEGDDDGWDRVSALFDTLGPVELLDESAKTTVHRLFHQDAPQWLDRRSLRFACSCSRERVAAMLVSLGRGRSTPRSRPAAEPPKSAASSAARPTASRRPRPRPRSRPHRRRQRPRRPCNDQSGHFCASC